MSHSLLVVLFALAMLPGLAGVLLPALPGIPYMFIVALIFGIIDRFVHLTVPEMSILFGITLASLIVDYSAGILGAKFGGASRSSILAGLIGMIIGFIMFPPLGALVGLFAGVMVGEIRARRTRSEAIKAATGTLIGTVTGVAINVVLALLFLFLFIIFAL